MKYSISEGLILKIESETEEDSALLEVMQSMVISPRGGGTINAGMSHEEGRRTYLLFGWRPAPEGKENQ